MAPFSLQPDRSSWVGASCACEPMTTTTILNNPEVHGYDPKKIPNWVTRSDKHRPPAPTADQSPSVAPSAGSGCGLGRLGRSSSG